MSVGEGLLVNVLWKGGEWVIDFLKAKWIGTKSLDLKEKLKRTDEIALVVNITNPVSKDVEKYLEDERINVEILEIEVVPEPGRDVLKCKEDWKKAVAEFEKMLSTIQKEVGQKRIHFFYSGPAILAFAMGCKMRNLFDFHLYQWNYEIKKFEKVLMV